MRVIYIRISKYSKINTAGNIKIQIHTKINCSVYKSLLSYLNWIILEIFMIFIHCKFANCSQKSSNITYHIRELYASTIIFGQYSCIMCLFSQNMKSNTIHTSLGFSIKINTGTFPFSIVFYISLGNKEH